MAQVTTDSQGNVVIQCSVDEAAALEVAASVYEGPESVNDRLHTVWDKLDGFIGQVVLKHPTMISLTVRAERRRIREEGT